MIPVVLILSLLRSGDIYIYRQDMSVSVPCRHHRICWRASFQTLRKKQHRLRVIRETKTRVSTSGDRGGGTQAVKLWEVLFGRTVGCIEQVKATWKGTMHTRTNKNHINRQQTHTQRQMETDNTSMNEYGYFGKLTETNEHNKRCYCMCSFWHSWWAISWPLIKSLF